MALLLSFDYMRQAKTLKFEYPVLALLATAGMGMMTQVDAALLVEAAAPLHRGVDAVVGPASDGGWWALGLRDPHAASAMAGVPTSRGDTGDRTIHALRAAGLHVELLSTLTDVDTAVDALAVGAAAPQSRFAAALATQPWTTQEWITTQ